MLVRSWNLFHGNTVPPGRRAYLREMIELVATDRPDVLCVQEVPAWALGRLGGWAGMTEVPALARRARLGPLPIPAPVGRALTAPNHGLIRSAFAGQGNAILLAPALRVLESSTLALGGREPRVAQRVELDGLVVANVHVSAERAKAELASILSWLDAAAPLVLAGDFNTTPERSPAIASLAGAIPGSIDQVLVRGAAAAARLWPEADREYAGRLLSDHAPVEAVVELLGGS